MPDVLIRRVPRQTLTLARRLAQRHRRTLQQELLLALERSLETDPDLWFERAQAIKGRLARKYGPMTDSTPLIREDRER